MFHMPVDADRFLCDQLKGFRFGFFGIHIVQSMINIFILKNNYVWTKLWCGNGRNRHTAASGPAGYINYRKNKSVILN